MSAGVYDSSDKLIRTLFSGKIFPQNIYTYDWDGKNDQGKTAPKSKYVIKLISNNVNYEWEGAIGNTSDSISGPTKWRGFGLANGLATAGKNVYVAQGYGEFMNSVYRFDVAAPNTKLPVHSKQAGVQLALATCTDSNYVYWAEWVHSAGSRYKSAWVIYATRVSDNKEVSFANGIEYTGWMGRKHSVIGLQDQMTDSLSAKASTAMAVQRKGIYLFVSRKTGNRVDVYHKQTGAFIRSLGYSRPTGLSVDRNDNLWMVTGDSVVSKFKVQTDGSLSAPMVTIKDLSQPQNVCVSHDGSYVLVADCGTSQQLKAFSNKTGARLWVLGEEGGYRTSAIVTNTRFMFSDITTIDEKPYYNIPAITFQTDGSFWFADNGNRRIMNFSGNRKYLNQIMYMGTTYFTKVVGGDPTRILCGRMEFSIDYSKPLVKAWKLTRNYGYYADAKKYSERDGIVYAAKFSNGRTYAWFRRAGKLINNWEIVELTDSGLRFSGILLPSVGLSALANDGSIFSKTVRTFDQPMQIRKQTVTGFDAKGNPLYSPEKLFLETPPVLKSSPVEWLHLQVAITENGYYWFFDSYPKDEANGYHLGAIPEGGNEWQILTAKGTGKTYIGDFPSDGRFDDGNNVNAYAGSQVTTLGKHVVWGYHGEFWKNIQVNKYNHYFENGLFLGQFGVTGVDSSVKARESAPQMAGNALTPVLVKGTDGNMYLYHGDESYHAGIHRWKITGLNTIEEIIIPLEVNKQRLGTGFRANRTGSFVFSDVNFDAEPYAEKTVWQTSSGILVTAQSLPGK
jgi:DNA-binding beta-propeller fold protein YncE